MRAVFVSLIAGFLCSLISGSLSPVAAQEPAAAPKAEAIEIQIQEAELVVQGKKLTIPFPLAELTGALGPGDRVSKEFKSQEGKSLPLKNWITTWDDLGVIAYCKPNTTKVISVAVCLAKKDYIFSPKSVYRGKVSVDGAAVTAKSKFEEINQAKKGTKLKDKIPGLPWSIDYQHALVTVGQNYVDDKPAGMAEVAISWKEPKPAAQP